MNEVETKDVGTTDLSAYMMKVIEELRRDRKPPAVHIYTCTLRSFIRFSDNGEEECSMPMQEVFTPGRLKEYEQWMLLRKLTQNTISTYMRTLRAVYNRWMPPGTAEHNPRLFDDVYTSVVSQTKRALTARQMEKLLEADLSGLSPQQQAVLAYFLLMFLLRGMPFIDLAHLRKRDMQDGRITYSRHKTDKPITVRIPREALVLIAKYADRHSASPYLFPHTRCEDTGQLAVVPQLSGCPSAFQSQVGAGDEPLAARGTGQLICGKTFKFSFLIKNQTFKTDIILNR